MKWRRFLWCMVLLNAPVGLQAQNPDNSGTVTQAANASTVVVAKPVRKPDQVVTNDSIGLLAVRRVPRTIVPPMTELAAARDEGIAVDREGGKAGQIVSLEKQIKDKQKRITLLLKLFANDEKEFLKNTGGMEADPVVQERRRYEQDELRWETAELAKLQARLDHLKTSETKN